MDDEQSKPAWLSEESINKLSASWKPLSSLSFRHEVNESALGELAKENLIHMRHQIQLNILAQPQYKNELEVVVKYLANRSIIAGNKGVDVGSMLQDPAQSAALFRFVAPRSFAAMEDSFASKQGLAEYILQRHNVSSLTDIKNLTTSLAIFADYSERFGGKDGLRQLNTALTNVMPHLNSNPTCTRMAASISSDLLGVEAKTREYPYLNVETFRMTQPLYQLPAGIRAMADTTNAVLHRLQNNEAVSKVQKALKQPTSWINTAQNHAVVGSWKAWAKAVIRNKVVRALLYGGIAMGTVMQFSNFSAKDLPTFQTDSGNVSFVRQASADENPGLTEFRAAMEKERAIGEATEALCLLMEQDTSVSCTRFLIQRFAGDVVKDISEKLTLNDGKISEESKLAAIEVACDQLKSLTVGAKDCKDAPTQKFAEKMFDRVQEHLKEIAKVGQDRPQYQPDILIASEHRVLKETGTPYSNNGVDDDVRQRPAQRERM